jgi:phosphoadenosine phosphosulfate reductase
MIKLVKKRKEYQPIVDTTEKERISIDRCIEYQNRDKTKNNILAFSGGKDSIVTYLIVAKSGIDFTPIYSLTSVDPPELVQYIKNIFNTWAESKGYPKVIFNKYNTWKSGENKGKIKTMWSLLSNREYHQLDWLVIVVMNLKKEQGKKGTQ